jgi:hypothetical protein
MIATSCEHSGCEDKSTTLSYDPISILRPAFPRPLNYLPISHQKLRPILFASSPGPFAPWIIARIAKRQVSNQEEQKRQKEYYPFQLDRYSS